MSQPSVSNDLACLRDCGLVLAEPNGRCAMYRLSDDRVGELIELAESLLADLAKDVFQCTRYANPVVEAESVTGQGAISVG